MEQCSTETGEIGGGKKEEERTRDGRGRSWGGWAKEWRLVNRFILESDTEYSREEGLQRIRGGKCKCFQKLLYRLAN